MLLGAGSVGGRPATAAVDGPSPRAGSAALIWIPDSGIHTCSRSKHEPRELPSKKVRTHIGKEKSNVATTRATARSQATDEDRLALLTELWGAWHAHGGQIGTAVWERPSGLGQWTVKELFGHVARQVAVLEDMLSRASGGAGAEVDFPTAADYFANFRGWLEEASALSARAAVEYTAGHSTGEMISELARAGEVIEQLSQRIDQVLPTPFGTTTARAYLTTRIVEATVHLIDLQRAVGIAESVPDRASEATALLLLEMCPRQQFIDAATGRGEPDFFPVLV